MSSGPYDKLLPLAAAAAVLGMSVKSLRTIVARSRRAARGEQVVGPTITFFQTGRSGALLFKREWLDAFIDEHTVDPGRTSEKPRKQSPRSGDGMPSLIHRGSSGFNAALYEIE